MTIYRAFLYLKDIGKGRNQQIPELKTTRKNELQAQRYIDILFTHFSLIHSQKLCNCILSRHVLEAYEWVFFSNHGREMKAKIRMKGINKSYFLSLACYKASRKMVNQLSKRILVGHKLSNACRYFVGKWSFTIFLAAVSFWYTVSKKYATPMLVQLICTKGHHQKTYSRFAYPCFILCPPFAQLLPPK